MRYLLIACLLVLTCTSCSGRNNSSKELDSLKMRTTGLEKELDSLKENSKTTKDTISYMKARLEESENKIGNIENYENKGIHILETALISILCALLVYLCTNKLKDNRQESDEMIRESSTSDGGEEREKTGIKGMKDRSFMNIQHQLDAMNKRIAKMEKFLREMSNKSDNKSYAPSSFNNSSYDNGLKKNQNHEDLSNLKRDTVTKYFGLAVTPDYEEGKYSINNIIDDKDDPVAAFKLTITGNTGTYEPNSLSQIKSLDIKSELLEISADSINMPEDSSEYKVIEQGRVYKKGGKWFVESPVIVKFI